MQGAIIECMGHTGWKGRLEMKSERITLRLVTGVKDKLQQEAVRRGITLHDLIVFVLWEAMQYIVPK